MTTPLLSDITTRLTPITDTPALDASVLIAHILHRPRTWIMAHPELTLTTEQHEQLSTLLARLEAGDAFPYVLGHWEFFGMDFDITPDVLIPRPETELLVEKAIAWLVESSTRRTVADVGTGSGVIAVSIAAYVPDVQVLATDISQKALQVAQKNATKFEVVDRIDFVQCDLLPEHPGSIPAQHQFDLICANLPYIPTETLRNLPVYGREPTLALDGGSDGLTLIRRLLQDAYEWLAPGGMLLLEIEATRGEQVVSLARTSFPEATVQLHQDLARQDRLLQIALRRQMKTNLLPATASGTVSRALEVLRAGGLVAFPTDTVYGVGSLAFDSNAVESIYAAKDRPIEKAIPILLGDWEDVEKVAIHIPSTARKLASRFWPGPLTILVPKKPGLPQAVSATSTVGVRVPDHQVARTLLRAAGPMAVTSANISGGASPTTAEEVFAQMSGRIELIIDGGKTPGGIPSTVVDCSTEEIKVLREGPITEEELLSAL